MKWVFRIKEDENIKERSVAKGFQIQAENSFETIYSIRTSIIKLLLSIALQCVCNVLKEYL